MELDLITKCRACLGDDKQMHYLFNEFDQGITLRDILTNTTKFEVEKEDGFSPYLCQNCTTIIVEFYNFKTIYEENENQIKSVLNSELNSVDSKVNDSADTSTAPTVVGKDNKMEPKNEDDDYITIKIETYNSDEEEEDSSDDFNMSKELPKDSSDAKSTLSDLEMEDKTKENEDGVYEYQEIKTFTCPECGDCFLLKGDIHAHMVSKHDISEIDYDEVSELSLLKVQKHEQTSENACKICNQQFESDEDFKKHMETHKKNVCDICGVGFIKKSYLKDHQEVHFSEKRHVCSYCNKAFKRRTVLVKHKRIHTHPRQCICEICGKAFNDKGTLKTHIMLLHVRERNYMCLICGVKFPLKGTLEKHIRRHQNKEREFFCTQCPLGYRDKSSLDRHIYVKHSGQSVKATCSDCGKQYTTVSNLFKHQRNCHGGGASAGEEVKTKVASCGN